MSESVRVLLVEDSAADAELIRRELSALHRSVEIHHVKDRAGFETELESLSVDIVLSDYNLPDIDGFEVIAMMRERYPLVPVVIVTGSISEEVAVECLKAGATDYVIKQHLARLVSAVDYALDHARLRRREAESRLEIERARDFYVTLLDDFPGPVWRTGVDGNIDYFNKAWLEFTGRTLEEEAGLGWVDGLHPDDRDAFMATWDVVISGRRPFSYEHRLRNADGTYHWVVDRGRPIFDLEGAYLGLLGSTYDIDGIRRAEAQARLLATALEAAYESIVITDARGSIEYVNPAFEALTQYSSAEIVGKNPNILKSGRQSEEFYRDMWDTISSGRTWRGRFVNRKKDGTLFEEDASISQVRNAGGEITHYVAVKRDATRERELEARLLQSQKLDAVGRLAGGVAHDLNNLFAVITGHADLLASALETEHPATRHLRQIRNATVSAAALTRQLLAFSRRQVLQPSNVNLNGLVSEIVELIERVIPEHIQIEQVLSADTPTVYVDRAQLEQVVINLAINARDAMPRGGMLRLTTSIVDRPGDKSADPLAGKRWVCLEVADNGRGISSVDMEHVFEPFYTTKTEGRGTGLGLATVYGVVKQSGGFVYASSNPGDGTVFSVYLPPSDGAATGRAERVVPAVVARTDDRERRILLVEDQEMLREMLQEGLESAGCIVTAAENGAKALQLAGVGARFDLLLTDVVMPGMSGSELANRLRRERPDLSVIYMSGYASEVVSESGLLDSDLDLLQKPFTIDELLERIQNALSSGSPT